MNKKIIPISAIALLLLSLPLTFGQDLDISATVIVSKYITVTFNYNTVDFGTVAAGSSSNTPSKDQTAGLYNATIDTNYDFKLEANGTDFTDGAGHSFGIGNLTVNSNVTASNLAEANGIQLTGTPQVVETNIPETTTTHYHGYWLAIPSGQYATSYSATVTETYSNL